MSYGRELAAALSAAKLAGAVILEHYAAFIPQPNAPASITTAADRAAQETILRHLQETFPDDAYCAEEDTPARARVPSSGPRLWIVDPIDGTRGFARKNGEFSVMIAFASDGRVDVGVVAEPAKERLTYAVQGGGCWSQDGAIEPRAARVSRVSEPSACTLAQSHSNPANGPTDPVRQLRPARVIETYSAGVKLAQVARGEADAYVCAYDRMHDWDLAAGHILVAEAGGRVSDLAGADLVYGRQPPVHEGGIAATNGALHMKVLQRLSGERGSHFPVDRPAR